MSGDQGGFTYLSVLILVVVSGIALMGTSTYWRTVSQRGKEAELLFRGGQIRRAIESYYNSIADKKAYPRRFEDLLLDSRSPSKKRHLRKLYKDPMTQDGVWGVILDKGAGIKGVFSKSDKTPYKRGGFDKENEKFEDARSYSKWKFIFEAS